MASFDPNLPSGFDPKQTLDPYRGKPFLAWVAKDGGNEATAASSVRLTWMASADAKRFRERACHCRGIAEEAHSPEWRKSLLELAKDLEDEADKIDAEEATTQSAAPLERELQRQE